MGRVLADSECADGWARVVRATICGMVLGSGLLPTLAAAQGGGADLPDGSDLYTPSEAATRSRPAPAAPATAPAPARSGSGLKVDPPALSGRWLDPSCTAVIVPWSPVQRVLYGRRVVEWKAGREWHMSWRLYGQEDCARQSLEFSLEGDGRYALPQPANALVWGSDPEQPWQLDWVPEQWSVVPHTREAVLQLFNDRCGDGEYGPGQRLTLAATGCPTFGIARAGAVEHDLVQLKGNRLFLGVRQPPDGVNRLGEQPLVREGGD